MYLSIIIIFDDNPPSNSLRLCGVSCKFCSVNSASCKTITPYFQRENKDMLFAKHMVMGTFECMRVFVCVAGHK